MGIERYQMRDKIIARAAPMNIRRETPLIKLIP